MLAFLLQSGAKNNVSETLTCRYTRRQLKMGHGPTRSVPEL